MREEILRNYNIAKEIYKKYGIDTDKVLDQLSKINISIHCWQGDDVKGFLSSNELSGGIQVTGNYPYGARNINELQKDIEKVLSLLPGNSYKLNVHAIYADVKEKVELDQLEPKHFKTWVDFAKKNRIGLDFNPTCFSHLLANDGTLSSNDEKVRNFWIRHCKACRKIAEYFGKELNQTCITNIWIPDGMKDTPIDRLGPRERLQDSLNQILEEKIDTKYNIDCVESKVFGIGAESYTVGSHEFYMGYSVSKQIGLTLDAGHYHPTEYISDKLSSVSLFVPHMLLHVSRPVRWDSDHVVIMDDELLEIARTLVRSKLLDKTSIGLDFFDASINRIMAWTIGTRSVIKALLKALLEPTELLIQIENNRNFTDRLYYQEQLKDLPFGFVFDYYLEKNNTALGSELLEAIHEYEKEISKERR